jgi:PAS domain S-box-containing protein
MGPRGPGNETPLRFRSGPPDAAAADQPAATAESRRDDAERSLRQVEEAFAQLVSGVSDYAIFLLDRAGVVETWNRGAERIKGYTADAIVGRHFSLFYPTEAVARGWPEHELATAASEGRFEDEGWRLRQDGSRFWANVVITALRDASGEVRGFLKITRDLTARRAAEEALQRSEERFRLLVEGVRDYANFMLDPDGVVSTWNAGAERIKGYRADQIVGRHFSAFYPADAVARRWPDHELTMARRDGRFEDEGWRVRGDGTRFWANVVITALHDERGELRGFAKITRDLTERRLAEEALKRAHAELEERVVARTRELADANAALRALEGELRQRVDELAEIDRHRNEFLAMLAHELRNPLAPIRNAVHILASAGDDPAVREDAQRLIARQVEHLVRLVDDLLDLSRVVRGSIHLQLDTVALATVIERAVETIRPVVDKHGHRLDVFLPGGPVFIDGDLVRLAQVVANLVGNAAKYTPEPGRIELRATAEPRHVEIRVRDWGVGIAPELLDRVFEPFVQADSSLARTRGGLGIGLTLVRRLVAMHHGQVRAVSGGPGQGTEMIVRLPRARVVAEDLETLAETASRRDARRRVLVVDDNVDSAESTALLLRLWGHEVRTAFDGEQALATVEDLDPHVVLLDIGLPRMNGYQVAALLRERRGERPLLLVALTGYGQPEDQRRSREAGFDVHMVKPLDAEALRALLRPPA